MKLNYIDWYLVELRRRLIDSLPLDQESSFILETKNHLESLTEEFITNGMDHRAAEVAAIERFGSPDKIASDCILGIRRTRERRLIQFATFLLGLLSINIIWESVTTLRGYPFAYAYSYSLVTLVILFGVYALVLGRIPARHWFALPVLCIAAFGVISGIRSTFYAPPYTFGAVANYRELHEQYEQLRGQHLVASKMEHETADAWRGMLSNAKDMKTGETTTIPRIVYELQRNRPLYGMSYSNDGVILDKASGKASFPRLPVERKLVLKGPLSAHDVRQVLLGRITEVQSSAAGRDRILTAMQQGLNIPVRTRIQTFISGEMAMYVIIIGPLAFVVSFLASKVRNRIRFREKNLRLA